jgi:hypothetical protein
MQGPAALKGGGDRTDGAVVVAVKATDLAGNTDATPAK